ncbi:hypothetical protein I9W82_004269 [Candida metapsilosis]|uniref:Major facilitator superfamily (MFS) profile domain-containing protein n=1 Tax=Candida metapsilosis TaxID=273372 RepID=A0A8H7ZDH0_9ASCO|nr:hypothetical protein I9W82_004269 [Candida metapsilosis]
MSQQQQQQEAPIAETFAASGEPNQHSPRSSQTDYSSHLNTSSDEKNEVQRPYYGPYPEFEGEADNGREPSIYSYPKEGNELTRLELNAQLSRELSRRITNTGSFLLQDYDKSEINMGENIPFPPSLPDRNAYCVAFNGIDDPSHPHNLPLYKKILYSISVAMAALSFSMGSAMFSQGTKDVMEIFHIGEAVVALGTSLFVFGFAAGPVLHGPLSELFGRKPIMVTSCLGYVCFSFAVATAKDIHTIMICRFFAGFTGSAPFVVAPAVVVDMFRARVRGMAMSIFASAMFGGPMIAPILGGFIVKNPNMGWRWTSYMSGIIGCVALAMNALILKETHHPVLLVRKAEMLRRKTGNWGIFAPHEEVSLSLSEIVRNNIMRPLKLLFTEPIIFLVSIYNAFIYGMLYALLTIIPTIFTGRYHWSQGVGELPYISILLGVFLGGAIIIYSEHLLNKKSDATGAPPTPEARLPPVMIGGVSFVVGIFWMGWTGDYAEHVHWIVPVIGAFFVGNGLMLIFLPTMNYIIECYLYIAASALAGNTFLRSSFGGAFPLFSPQMFNNLTIKWAATLLGCLGLLMLPLPFVFYKYGAAARRKSKNAMS